MLKGAPVRAVIAVSDADKAKAFYVEKLGLTFVEENPGGMTVQAGDGTYLRYIHPSSQARPKTPSQASKSPTWTLPWPTCVAKVSSSRSTT